jgi:NHL repeat
MTSIDSRLFVLHSPNEQQIQVYDTKTFTQQQTLQVKGLGDDTSGSGLIACVTNKCLYVSDWSKYTVFKVELTGKNKLSSWQVDRRPYGLSLNTICNLLVACHGANKIQEYTTCGLLVREICLRVNDCDLYPYHAIQLASGQFVVGCSNGKWPPDTVYDVVEVDTKGRVVLSYNYQLESTSQPKFNWPRRLSVVENNRHIIVTDCWNQRILILNRSMNCCARELDVSSVDGGLQRPTCLHFDESQNRLFVGESKLFSQCRVLVFDNVI